MNRETMLQQLQITPEWDIIIIGGGATGVGAALDASSRGYKTLLIEQFDFGKGTSSRSTKLVHGGVRYLAQGNIKLVLDALRERGYLLKNAPHLTSSLAFVVPVYTWFDKFFYGTGLQLYDLMSGKLSIGKTKWLNKKETINHLPGIVADKLKGGILYFDGQFDDARLTIELALTANKYGATLLNYCMTNQFIKTGNKISGIVVEDTLHKTVYDIYSRVIINATGVFADSIMQMDEPEEEGLLAFSQGIHLVIDKHFFPGSKAMMIPDTDDGRVFFAVPWHGKILLGTTDTPVEEISFEPQPMEEEIEFVLHHANRYLQEKIKRMDVLSMFAGLRPLVQKKGAKNTALLSRDHAIIVSKSGLVTITGGKWTTYRKMAQDAIDNAIFVAKLDRTECITRNLAIGQVGDSKKGKEESFTLASFNFTEKDITQFVEKEMAVTVEDILARRTRLLFLDAKAAIDAAPWVAKTMAVVMKKDDKWINEQVTIFTELANQYVLK